MRSVLYLVRKPPGIHANELIDMMLVSGVFEQPTQVLFLDDGVWQLNAGQDAGIVGRKDTSSALGALDAHGIQALFAHKPSLDARGIARERLAVEARPVGDDGMRALLRDADVVVTD